MGHQQIEGPAGSIEALKDLRLGRRIFVHINNTNPILDPHSEAAKTVRAAGWEVGYDGMEVTL